MMPLKSTLAVLGNASGLSTTRPQFRAGIKPSCLLCLASDQEALPNTALCQYCADDLPWLGSACPRCALPMVGSQALATSECGQCIASPPSFDASSSALIYEPPIATLLQDFKYKGDFGSGRLLATLLATHIRSTLDPDDLPELLIPVPTHWRRHLQRGFNPALILATAISQELSGHYLSRAPQLEHKGLRKTVYTPHQVGLKRRQRARQLRHSFEWRGSKKPAERVAVIDDVMTTGATAQEISRCLKARGVEHVQIWTIARTQAPPTQGIKT